MTCQKGSYEVKNHGVSEEKKNARTYGGGGRLEWGRRGKLARGKSGGDRFSSIARALDISQCVMGHWKLLSRWGDDTTRLTFLNDLSDSCVERSKTVLRNMLLSFLMQAY